MQRPKNSYKNIFTDYLTKVILLFFLLSTSCNVITNNSAQEIWSVGENQDWMTVYENSSGIIIKEGELHIKKDSAFFATNLRKFNSLFTLKSVKVKQNSQWNNWQPIPKVAPETAKDAPVFIPVSEGNYWLLARHSEFSNTGYHAWSSKDMMNWIHHGAITSVQNRWVTTAEYFDGNFYIYFDKPNDEETFLIIDQNLSDGIPGKEMGRIFDNPSHGSDIGIFRDEDGTFHLIYEDWSPINPRLHSWDSPLAGHAESHDGINGFEPHEFPPPIDERTTPTGEINFYEPHPTQLLMGKDFSPYSYEVHEEPQDAFGDYTIIKVGDQYYIFSDYDPKEENKTMRIGRWRSNNIEKQFIWDGEIGENIHPDPTVGFAEGKFYLLVQSIHNDFISDGPWIDGVEIRAGVDIDNDGEIDNWTPFRKIKEVYSQKDDFMRVVNSDPALLQISELPAGYAFKIEMLFYNHNNIYPIIDSFEAIFEEE